jgi:hypothetical protein
LKALHGFITRIFIFRWMYLDIIRVSIQEG